MANLLKSIADMIRQAIAPRSTPAPAPGKPAKRKPAQRGPAPRGPVPTGPKPHDPRAVAPQGNHLEYAPNLDGDADPGEIVWTWVKYEDDPSQGKDRPVLVVGRSGRTLLGLMLSSQSERDGQRNWLGLGPGDWDRESRPSWIRLDRVLELDQDGIRREGSILDRTRFDKVASVLRKNYGWQ